METCKTTGKLAFFVLLEAQPMPSLTSHVLFMLLLRSYYGLFAELQCLLSAKNCRNSSFCSKKLKNSYLVNGKQRVPVKNRHVTPSSRGTHCEGRPVCAACPDSSGIA